jgi:alpha-galactosidase
MLDAAARYRVGSVAPEGEQGAHWFHSTAPFFTALKIEGVELDGAWLAHAGLPVPRATAEACMMVRLQRI